MRDTRRKACLHFLDRETKAIFHALCSPSSKLLCFRFGETRREMGNPLGSRRSMERHLQVVRIPQIEQVIGKETAERNCRSSIVNQKERSAMTMTQLVSMHSARGVPARFHPSHPSFVTLILFPSRTSIGCSRCSPAARTPRVDTSASRIAMQNDAANGSAFSMLCASIVLALRACTISIHANPPHFPPSPSICIRRAAGSYRGCSSISNKTPFFWKAATVVGEIERSRDRRVTQLVSRKASISCGIFLARDAIIRDDYRVNDAPLSQLSVCVWLCDCLCLPVCLSVCLSVCLPVCLSVSQSVRMRVHTYSDTVSTR